MSIALVKMWFSLGSIAGMSIAVLLILLSRHKLNNKFLKGVTAFFAYTLMIFSGLIMLIVVLSGPTYES